MNDYYEVRLDMAPCDETLTDIMAALLADAGYESFQPDDNGLTAWVPAAAYTPEALSEAVGALPLDSVTVTTRATLVEGRDWNAEWEKNYFKPIVIGNRCVVHSSFHTDVPAAEYDIVIDPKMAFGTGHHDTTSLIVGQLLELNLEGKAVIDMGTGTAILAILAAMRGASPVGAIEIDPFAAVNARENTALNNHAEINVIEGDASSLPALGFKADLFLANINRNVITGDLPAYVKALKPGATVIFSGFYDTDAPIVIEAAAPLGLTPEATLVSDGRWCSLRMKYNVNE